MPDRDKQAALSLQRLLPRLHARFASEAESSVWQAFISRLERECASLFAPLIELYGHQYDFFYHLEEILASAARAWLDRPEELRALDAAREQTPRWFQSEQMFGAVCYVDRFAGTLKQLADRLPYLRELGVTYLHVMPLFLSPSGNSDGGYAVSSYREVRPDLGTIDDLAALAAALRAHGISLVLDFIFNHTADDHVWARRAQMGDEEYQAYYYVFPDRTLPDAYQQHLRDIFPEQRPGSFTYRPDMSSWVWTTFNSFQWDLNYSNPVVFQRMGEEMLFLANHGAEILRLDAVAFAWKEMGTSCESLPQVHTLVRAFHALARIAAPSLIFKSEAIVHPDEVARYIAPHECQLSYNPLLMALLWESLATREVRLLELSMRTRFHIDQDCAWVNYVRSHDDIGWTFADGDAARLGIDSVGHRRFLNDFYSGRFPGSFAAGLPFQENPRTGDARISGTCASLAGLERALHDPREQALELAIRRILLLYGVVLSIGGIPLLYLGDEIGTCNDYGYAADPHKAGDSRWVHRPPFDWASCERRHDPESVEGRIFGGLQQLIAARKAHPVLAGGDMEVVHTGNGGVFGYVRRTGTSRLLVLANFTEREQRLHDNDVRVAGQGYAFEDLVSGTAVTLDGELVLAPYALLWLVANPPRHYMP
jgi:amylosucrase